MPQKGNTIIVTGPTASGKTTVRWIMHKYVGSRMISFALTPFDKLTYFFMRLLEKILKKTDSHYEHPMSYLETYHKYLVPIVLKVAIPLDLIQVILVMVLIRLLNSMGYLIAVEDYVPAILLDHILYSHIYGISLRNNKFIKILWNAILGIVSNHEYRYAYVMTDTNTRFNRSLIRGYRVVRSNRPHDIARTKILTKVVTYLANSSLIIINNNGSVRDTVRQVANMLNS